MNNSNFSTIHLNHKKIKVSKICQLINKIEKVRKSKILKEKLKVRSTPKRKKNGDTLLDMCVSSLRRGHANLLCIVPILADDPPEGGSNSHWCWCFLKGR